MRAVALLAATTAAQSTVWLDTLNRAQDQCGDLEAPENSFIECGFTTKTDMFQSCYIHCKAGFMFDNYDLNFASPYVEREVRCQEGHWNFGQNQTYAVDNWHCVRQTPCRINNGDCTEGGAWKALQCEGLGDCWCVDIYGQEVEGTRAGPGDETPQCAGLDAPPAESPQLPEHYDWHDACVVWAKGEWYKTFDGKFFGYAASSCQMTLLESSKGLTVYQLSGDYLGRTTFDVVQSAKKETGRFMFNGATNMTGFMFHGRMYGLDEAEEAVVLADTFKVYRQSNAVVVVDMIEQIKMVFNEDAFLVRSRFGLATAGLCGSFNADAEDDITNAYGHVTKEIASSADTWRASCPVTPFYRSSAEGEKVMVAFINQMTAPSLIKRIDQDGTYKVVAELEHNQFVVLEVKTSEVFIAEDPSGYKYRINGLCALMPTHEMFAFIGIDACRPGVFITHHKKCNAFNPVHGDVDCQVHDGIKVCALTCDAGYRSESTNLFVCNLEDGTYQPALPRGGERFPSCISETHKCSWLDAPVNGDVKCEDKGDGLRCFPTCNEDFEFASAIPMTGYYTCTEGKWNPYPYFPECIKKTENVDESEIGKVLGVMNIGQVSADQTGYCMAWGQHHYRTFDGKMFRFQGACSYTLVKDVLSGSFSIEVVNDGECSPESGNCKRSINIYIADTWITLTQQDGEPVAITRHGEQLSLPNTFYSLHLTRVADYVVVKEAANSWALKWDGDQSIFIKVDENLVGQTGGLCGVYDHDQNNDLTNRDGVLVKSVALFANSWKTDETCADASEETFCNVDDSEGMRKSTQAIMLCSYIMDTECADVIDPTPYFEACKEDVCYNVNADLGEMAPCNSMAAYFRECSRHGVHVAWRDEGRCPVECPTGQEYHPCGSSCAPSCFNPEAKCTDEHCIDGCHCPFGTFAHEGQCLARDQCPCLYGEQVYQPRERVRRDCNQCVCLGGNFHCTENQCDGVCSVIKSHVRSFDGKEFSFHGECSYVLMESIDKVFSLVMINKDCSGKTCGRSLIFRFADIEIKLMHGGQVHVKGEPVAQLPVRAGEFIVERVSHEYIAIVGLGGRVLWDENDSIVMRMSADLKHHFTGLCGNFNDEVADDFMTPEGDIEETVLAFVEKWEADECFDKKPFVNNLEPCVQYENRYPFAKEACSIFNSAAFEKCHDLIDYEPYQYECMQDYCSSPDQQVMCSAATLYAMACAKEGLTIENWREDTECKSKCPSGQVFNECGKACQTSCGALALGEEHVCIETCVPGCQCPDGMVLSHEGTCIAPTECSCFWNGREYFAGESRTHDCNVCECHKGAWVCTKDECENVQQECGEAAEWVQCKRPSLVTCFNMHLEKQIHEHFDYHCESGCQCSEGYVFDEVTSACIVAEQCPCYHGGKSYRTGEAFMMDCNTCACGDAGNWQCTGMTCDGQCRAYGDSHIETFDGKRYQFQGECEYIYAAVPGKFEITAANEACGSKGTVCTKSITFKVGDSRINVVRGSPITTDRDSAFELRFAGLWVFIEAKEIGVTLMWDKGTTMVIKVAQEYQNQLGGLCGDYNMDIQKDLVARTGISTEDILEFAHSWAIDSTCAKPVHVKDICALNPIRKTWSTKRCSVIKDPNGPFAKCHSHVDPEYYFSNCKYDACACDTGGECECLCTAVAAYAQACNAKGIHVRWRHQGLCPMQCDGCREYTPCVSACPLTCGNLGQWEKVESACEEVCVEGCECVDDTILSEDGTECLKMEECFCQEIDGVKYAEGEKINALSDDCQSCYCMHGKTECVGLPCPGATTPGTGPTTPEYTTGTTPGPQTTKPIEECEDDNTYVCAFKCVEACHSHMVNYARCWYDHSACVDVCSEEKPEICPTGQVLSDLKTCIEPKDCSCGYPGGITPPECPERLAPGQTCDSWSTCQRFYCWSNNLSITHIPGAKCACEYEGKEYVPGNTWKVSKCKTCECLTNYETYCIEPTCEDKPQCFHSDENDELFEVNALYMGTDGCCDIWKCPPEEECSLSKEEIPPTPVSCEEGSKLTITHHPDDANCCYLTCQCDYELCIPADLVTPCPGGCKPKQSQEGCCAKRVCDCENCVYGDGTIANGKKRGDTWIEDECLCYACSEDGDITRTNKRDHCDTKPVCKENEKLISLGVFACCETWVCEPIGCPEKVGGCEVFAMPESCPAYMALEKEQINECCHKFTCECSTELCETLDDSPCVDGSEPEFLPDASKNYCCYKRICPVCEHKGKKYNFGQVWESADGCTTYECKAKGVVSDSPTSCPAEFGNGKLGFISPAPTECAKGGHVVYLPEKPCCNYGKCVYPPPQCELCPVIEEPEDPDCGCQYQIVVKSTQYYTWENPTPKENCPAQVQCPKTIKTCECSLTCATLEDTCGKCYKFAPQPDCCGCKQHHCEYDASQPGCDNPECVDNAGNKRKLNEIWYKDAPNTCFPCVCTQEGDKCSTECCTDYDCSHLDIQEPQCEEHETVNTVPHPEDKTGCCFQDECDCHVENCMAHVKSLGLAKSCKVNEVAEKTMYKGCCEYVFKCVPVSTTTYIPPTTVKVSGCTNTPIGVIDVGKSYTSETDKCDECVCNEDEEIVCSPKQCPTPQFPFGCPLGQEEVWGYVDEDLCCNQIVRCAGMCKTGDAPVCDENTKCPEYQRLVTIESKDFCSCPTFQCQCDYTTCPEIDVEQMKANQNCPNGDGYIREIQPSPCCPSYECVCGTAPTTTPGTDIPVTTPAGPACLDTNECPRLLGESWYSEGDVCRVCSCCERGNIQCFDRYCPEVPVCKFNEHLMSYKIDDCCHKHVCVPEKCNGVQCPEPECCEYFEDSVVVTEDECCQKLTCQCNPAKCVPIKCGPCEDRVVESTQDDCCAQRCVAREICEDQCECEGSYIDIGATCNPLIETPIGPKPAHCKTCKCRANGTLGCRTRPIGKRCEKPRCAPKEILDSQFIDNDCCMKNICVPKECENFPKARCNRFSHPDTVECVDIHEIKKVVLRGPTGSDGDKCCPHSWCVCKPKRECPELTCPPGEVLKGVDSTTSKCCDEPICEQETTTTPPPPQCVDHEGKARLPGENWYDPTKYPELPAECVTCCCTDEDEVICSDAKIECSPDLLKACPAGLVDAGVQLVGCCEQRICECPNLPENLDCADYDHEEPCPAYHEKEVFNTGPGGCCLDRICTCKLSLCPKQNKMGCPEGFVYRELDELLEGCCKQWICEEITGTTTPPPPPKCESYETYFKDEYQCSPCVCVDTITGPQEVCSQHICPQPLIICKPNEYTTITKDSCGCDVTTCTKQPCNQDCEGLGYYKVDLCLGGRVAYQENYACTYDKGLESWSCQMTEEISEDDCHCYNKKCRCPECVVPTAEEFCGRADCVVNTHLKSAGECCDTHSCDCPTTTTPPPDTTSCPPQDCVCVHLGNEHVIGSSWEHNCQVHTCSVVNNGKYATCDTTTQPVTCGGAPTCLESETLCVTQGSCCKHYSCKPKNCDGKCGDECLEQLNSIVCNVGEGECKQIKGSDPENPCCNMYECGCCAENCPALGDAPMCKSDDPCVKCEPTKVMGTCCEKWACECNTVVLTDQCLDGDRLFNIDETWFKDEANKCQACVCKKQLVDGQLVPVVDCEQPRECTDPELPETFNKIPVTKPECLYLEALNHPFTGKPLMFNCCPKKVWQCKRKELGCGVQCPDPECENCVTPLEINCGPVEDIVETAIQNPENPKCPCVKLDCKCNVDKCTPPSPCPAGCKALLTKDEYKCCNVLDKCDCGDLCQHGGITYQVDDIIGEDVCQPGVCKSGGVIEWSDKTIKPFCVQELTADSICTDKETGEQFAPTHVGYTDEHKCCAKYECGCVDYIPSCEAGYILDAGVLNKETGCTKFSCICDPNCPVVEKPPCGEEDCCILVTEKNECGCATQHSCECQEVECIDLEDVRSPFKYGTNWNKHYDVCMPCTCNKNGTISCEYNYTEEKPVCGENEKLHLAVMQGCNKEYECVPIDSCIDMPFAQCKLTYPQHYGIECGHCEQCGELSVIEGSEGCCFKHECICKETCDDIPVQCGAHCETVLDDSYVSNCGEQKHKCKCPCMHNGVSYDVNSQWYENQDECKPCCCGAEGDVTCIDLRLNCPGLPADAVCASETMVLQQNKELSTSCCPYYECVCPGVDCSAEYPEHYPIEACSVGYKQIKTADLNECCGAYECQCDLTQCPLKKLLNKKCPQGSMRKLVVDECGCEYHDCITETYCTHKGFNYKVGQKWNCDDDICQPCECLSDGTPSCGDIRKEFSDAADKVICPELQGKYVIVSHQCGDIYGCCDEACPTVAECEAEYGPMAPTEPAPCGMKLAATGEKLHKITKPDGSVVECCEKLDYVCEPCVDEEVPICAGKGCALSTVDCCGCKQYTCSGCYDCEYEDIKLQACESVEVDECVTCTCSETGEIDCVEEPCEEAPTCAEGCKSVEVVSLNPCCKHYECSCDCEQEIDLVQYCSAYTKLEDLKCDTAKGFVARRSAQHCYQGDETCCCQEYSCQCPEPKDALCTNQPPTCAPGQSYEVRSVEGSCCFEYGPCQDELETCPEFECESTVFCDFNGKSLKGGHYSFLDEEKCQAVHCSCDGELITGNTCEECIEQPPVCDSCCSYTVHTPDYNCKNNCPSYSSCECPDLSKNCKLADGKLVPIGFEYFKDTGINCEPCKCVVDENTGVASIKCTEHICADDEVTKCSSQGLCEDIITDNCGCTIRKCKNCCADVTCPVYPAVTCSPTFQLTEQILETYLKPEDPVNKCPCFKDICKCVPDCPAVSCPEGQEAVTKRDSHDCCDILIECVVKQCTHAGDDYVVGDVIYENGDVEKCSPLICSLISGEYKFVPHGSKPEPCIADSALLEACPAGEVPCDGYELCCYTRVCVPEECEPQEPITCDHAYKSIITMLDKYIGKDKDVACYKKVCECDKSKCPAIAECGANCTPKLKTVDCGCQVLDTCECAPTTVPPTTQPTTPYTHKCVDETGCVRKLGETWYYNEDACHTCACLENGLVSCNDRSALCMDVPTCAGNERLAAYACDECCLSYECVEDKCWDACWKIEQPCCEAHETVKRFELEDENGCACPTFVCCCDDSKCPEYDLDEMDCGCNYCKAVQEQAPRNYVDGTEGECLESSCCAPPPVCQCEIPTCPGIQDSSKCIKNDLVATVCTADLVCDGESWVDRKECPCMTKYGAKAPGSTWKDGNCKTCSCINGLEQCTGPVCAQVKCGKGFKAVIKPGECCESCELVEQCCVHDDTGVQYAPGAEWLEGCDLCLCIAVDNGSAYGKIKCVPQPCIEDCPTCLGNGMIAEAFFDKDVNPCCDTCLCKCNPEKCMYNDIPECDCAHELIYAKVNPEDCCAEPKCVPRPDLCPVVPAELNQCINGQKLIVSGEVTMCSGVCDAYEFVACGCKQQCGEGEQLYAVSTQFNYCENNVVDKCRVCTCLADGVMDLCPPVECDVEKPVCSDGREPIRVEPQGDNCCESYVCRCSCSGVRTDQQLISTYDSANYKLNDVNRCEHRITYDACNNNFEVFAHIFNEDEEDTSSPNEIKYFAVIDHLKGHKYVLNSDFILERNGQTVSLKSNPQNEFGSDYVNLVADSEIRLFIEEYDLLVRFKPVDQSWTVSVSRQYAGCTLGLCGVCDANKDNDIGVLKLNPFRQIKSTLAFIQANRVDNKDPRCSIEYDTCACTVSAEVSETLTKSDQDTWAHVEDPMCTTCKCVCEDGVGSEGEVCLQADGFRRTTTCRSVCTRNQIPECMSCPDGECDYCYHPETGEQYDIGEIILNEDGCPMSCLGKHQWSAPDLAQCGCEGCECERPCLEYTNEDAQDLCPIRCGYQVVGLKKLRGRRRWWRPAPCCPRYRCQYARTPFPEICNEACPPDYCEPPVCDLPIDNEYLNQCCIASLAHECYRIYLNPALDDCDVVVDPELRVHQCLWRLNLWCLHFDHDEVLENWYEAELNFPACDEVEQFARECSCETGICRNDWRQDYYIPLLGIGLTYYSECPIEKCNAGRVFNTCGPTMERTCYNRQFYDIFIQFGMVEFTKEGCFCPQGTVLDWEGNCVSEDKCDCIACELMGITCPTKEEYGNDVCHPLKERPADALSIQWCPAGDFRYDPAECCPAYICECEPAYCREGVRIAPEDIPEGYVVMRVPVTEDIEGNFHNCCLEFDEILACPLACPEPSPCVGDQCTVSIANIDECGCVSYTCTCDPSQCGIIPGDILDQMVTTCPTHYELMVTDTVLYQGPCSCCEPIYKTVCICSIQNCPVAVPQICGPFEVSKFIEAENACCCDRYECVCEEECPKSDELPCPEGMYLAPGLIEANKCCDAPFICVCGVQPFLEQCPDCTEAVDVIDVSHPCQFKKRTCVPLLFCNFEGKTHKPGALWTPKGDKCTTCYCPSEPNADGLFVATCNTECCGDCAAGHVRVPDATTCCGLCVPLTCTDNDNNQRAVGDVWKANDDKCVSCTCKQGRKEIYAECFSTRRAAESDCPKEFLYTSPDGCVQECRRPQSVGGCGVTKDYTGRVQATISGMFCESTQDYTINMCSGECVSASATKEGKIRKECSCCSATSVVTREIDVKCEDGTTRKHTIELVEECMCNSTKCEDADLIDMALDATADALEGADSLIDDTVDAVVDVAEDVVDAAKDVVESVWSWFG